MNFVLLTKWDETFITSKWFGILNCQVMKSGKTWSKEKKSILLLFLIRTRDVLRIRTKRKKIKERDKHLKNVWLWGTWKLQLLETWRSTVDAVIKWKLQKACPLIDTVIHLSPVSITFQTDLWCSKQESSIYGRSLVETRQCYCDFKNWRRDRWWAHHSDFECNIISPSAWFPSHSNSGENG